MSTHALISYKISNDEYKTIYVHNDGMLSSLGNKLLNYYNSDDKALALVNLGDLSAVYKLLEPTTSTHSFNNPEKDVTIAYHRDRGEDYSIAILNSDSLIEWSKEFDIEESYLWNEDSWFVRRGDSWVLLRSVTDFDC